MLKQKNNGVRWLATAIVLFFTLLPAEVWTAAYFLAGPTGFWQKFALIGLGLALFGGAQVVFAIIGFIAIFCFIWD